MEPITLVALLAFIALIICWMALPSGADPAEVAVVELAPAERSAARA